MADVITKFKLETTQFDSKLRDTAKALHNIASIAQNAGKDFNGFSQKSISAARALGTVASGATNTKDRLRDLVGSYNDAVKAYDKLSDAAKQGEFGKAMAESLTQLHQRIKETKQELYSLGDELKGGEGLFGDDKLSGMLQVFGGNLMTKAAEYVASLGSEVVQCMNESARLAREAEGVQVAFERLGRGDLLDGLREATHGTVSDFELMKAAVKFSDFKLPLEELGTMLAFAQQKAKDTGQSVDYMVDSIVTGLGRKSLMILDNLGLSAAEIRDKMKETGDMTKAVGEIIREQMAKAGDYVETASDRAAQSQVKLQNAMLELGNSMREVFGYTGWEDLANGIKTELVGAIQFTIETIGEAKKAVKDFLDIFDQAFGSTEKGLRKAVKKQKDKPSPPPDGAYYEETDADGNVIGAGRWMNGQKKQTTAGEVVVIGTPRPVRTTGGGGGNNNIKEITGLIPKAEAEVKSIQEQLSKSWDEGEIARLNEQLVIAQQNLKRLKDLGKAPDFEKMFPDLSPGESEGSKSPFDNMLSSVKVRISDENIAVDENAIRSLMTVALQNGIDEDGIRSIMEEALQNGIDGMELDFTSFMERLFEDGGTIFDEEWQALMDKLNERLEKMGKDKVDIDKKTGKVNNKKDDSKKKEGESTTLVGAVDKLNGGMQQVVGGMEKLGITVPEGFKNVMNGISGAISFIQGIYVVVQAIVMMKSVSRFLDFFANGGIVPHAAGGYLVGGNSYSGDTTPVLANAGELILSQSQQSALAGRLQSGMSNISIDAVVTAEDIRFVLNNNGRRTGRGEFVQSNRRR